MKPRERKFRAIFPLTWLTLAVIACVANGGFPEVETKDSVAILVFESKVSDLFQVNGLEELRAIAAKSGKSFDIVQRHPLIKWQGDPWKTAAAYRDGLVRDSNLWELRVHDADPEVAVNAANLIVVQVMDLCETKFNERYGAWLETLTPSRYREETMMPGCRLSNPGLNLWQRAESTKPKPGVLDSLSRKLMEELLLQF